MYPYARVYTRMVISQQRLYTSGAALVDYDSSTGEQIIIGKIKAHDMVSQILLFQIMARSAFSTMRLLDSVSHIWDMT